MNSYLLKNNSKSLIVVFCGWGMDEKPFLPVKASSDILYLYDYSDLSINFDFSKYDDIKLIAFSYGVYVSALVQKQLPQFSYKTAVNGTLTALGDYGVPEKVFCLTLENMTMGTAVKFRERLFIENRHLELFNENLPEREIENSLYELAMLKKYFYEQNTLNYSFDKIYISSKDKIIPTKNQKNYWISLKKHPVVNIIEAGHFPFYYFKSIEELC